MTMDQRDDERRSSFALDREADKESVEDRIAHSIEDQVRGLDGKEVERAVRQKYEELLAHAKVKQRVLTLTEGVWASL